MCQCNGESKENCPWCRLQVCGGQGRAPEEVFGCGKSDREQRWRPANGTGVALLGYDPVQLLVGEARGDLVAVLQSADVRGRPWAAHKAFCPTPEPSPGQSRGEPQGKHQGPKSKDSRAAVEPGREDCILHYRASLVHSSEGIVKRKITLFVKSHCPFPLWQPLVQLGEEHWR